MSDITEWVSLGEAAKILGVHPATVRNWADRGELPFRRTPGGHRRFRRNDLAQWATSQHSTQPAETQLIVQSALGGILIELDDDAPIESMEHEGYAKIGPKTREALRAKTRRLTHALMARLSGAPTGNGTPVTPTEAGHEFAVAVREQGAPLTEAVRGLAFFNRFVIDAVIQLSETGSLRSPSELGDLLRRVHAFLYEALVATVEAYQKG